MAVSASPTRTFANLYSVTDNGDGTYKIGQNFGGPNTISDTPDQGANDDLTVIGDRSPDNFVLNSSVAPNPFLYAGEATDRSGIVGVSNGGGRNGTPYLFTDSTYTSGANFPVDNNPFVIVCFATGTRIGTTRGETPVEDLRAGDLVVTASGEPRPIRWIGSRTLAPRRHPSPADAQPVRIRAHAFGENQPARDLLVSPGHAIAVDVVGAVLIPAGALVDGITVVREDVDTVTYWHVELDGHDLLLAEGLAAESYLDMGNRAFFGGEGVVALRANPDADPTRRTHADFCRPFHATGPLVDLVRAQLAVRRASGQAPIPRAA